jgi:hypothetical protein
VDGFGCVLAERGVGRVNGIVMFLISFEGTRAFEDIDGSGPCSAFKTLFHAAGFDALLGGLHSISTAKATISTS